MTQRMRGIRQRTVQVHVLALIPAPLRRSTFRLLWLGMTTSYAGDRLQQLAQGWLVATITGSALAVGWLAFLGSIPLLLLPLGGVIADQVDRRRLLIAGQLVGATVTLLVALLLLTQLIAIWHIYAWALINGTIMLLARPAYKVVLTKAVPSEEVRPAVAINSMTETGALVTTNAAGSMLLAVVGLPVAFVLNTASYLVAAASLWILRDLDRQPSDAQRALAVWRILHDLRDGIAYLLSEPRLLRPLLLTFVTLIAISPTVGLLPAIVHAEGGSIVNLGLLAAAVSVGGFLGAGYAGARSEGADPTRSYALLGFVTAGALVVFAYTPLGVISAIPLAVIGSVAFAQAVWNTSRVGLVADGAYQARLQAVTSMAFTLGFSVGMLWGGAAIDRFGLTALVAGALGLAALSLFALLAAHEP